ncbi:MAG TPA: hypothetical protein DE109_03335 [Aeromonas sp.]|nr:hypothetical protein [Aeromonas sp.]
MLQQTSHIIYVGTHIAKIVMSKGQYAGLVSPCLEKGLIHMGLGKQAMPGSNIKTAGGPAAAGSGYLIVIMCGMIGSPIARRPAPIPKPAIC